MSSGYPQGHFLPEIVDWIQNRRLGGPVQCQDVVPALPVGDAFGAIAWRTVIMEQGLIQEQLLHWWYHAFM
jgi:hypothetical protein